MQGVKIKFENTEGIYAYVDDVAQFVDAIPNKAVGPIRKLFIDMVNGSKDVMDIYNEHPYSSEWRAAVTDTGNLLDNATWELNSVRAHQTRIGMGILIMPHFIHPIGSWRNFSPEHS
ncbi:hypothetical protein SAMN05444004_1126 [Jannaschia faecimaris]|uniref:Uncharacterized protein n=1 Tax=Jannaschia faecimaris TaxID=1244108 RepID=A0A1H3SHR6_9RHOB|nr:hypothetical protein SAMN05444004_1126 [Jannaschia faecimaris]